MEGEADVKPDIPRIGKRPLGARASSGGESQPRKLKPSTKLSPSAVSSYFQMESRVHDVEEHFRRSFQQMNNRPHPVQAANSSSTSSSNGSNDVAMVTNSEHVIINENTSPDHQHIDTSPEQNTSLTSPSESSESGSHHAEEPVEGVVASSPNLVSPRQHGTTALPPLMFSLPSGPLATESLKSIKSYNEVLSLAAAQQLLTAAGLGQTVTGSSGRSLVYPNILPISQSSLIPVVDSNGVTQLMAAASPAATHSSQPPPPQTTVPPIVFLGPGGIPLLPAAATATQPTGMYLVNTPTTDLQQSPSAASVTPPSLSAVTTSQPSYIVFPQSFQMPQTLTLEQLQSRLSATIQHQRQEQLQRVHHGGTGQTLPRQTVVNSDASSIPPVRPSHNHHNVNGDEVEEHFARALGEKWHQFKKDGSPPNKIST